MTRQELIEKYQLQKLMFLQPKDFDYAIVGVSHVNGNYVTAYSMSKILSVLMQQGMSYEQAYEYYSFNIHGAYMGQGTPIYIQDE